LGEEKRENSWELVEIEENLEKIEEKSRKLREIQENF
jgi:hypothetical protein